MDDRPLYVTEPFLPPLEEYVEYLKGIWQRNQLTNQGPLVKQLEFSLQEYHALESPLHCVANGGLGLQIALKALKVSGEVVTTPFSYVATVSCPIWEGCRVKFVDIDATQFTIDTAAVEAAITPRTEAILATHVFGNPCDVEKLAAIGSRHGLAVIYDAAHAFGVTLDNRSVLEWGDASMVSMHATKLFHTVEGGFVYANDASVRERVHWMRRFAHDGTEDFHGVGINAKMSEVHAAMGLCNLKYLPTIQDRRRRACEAYEERLSHANRKESFLFQSFRVGASRNYAYFPVLFRSERSVLSAIEKLAKAAVYPRRYFYPALNQVPRVWSSNDECPVAESVAKRILCLPLSHETGEEEIEKVCACLC